MMLRQVIKRNELPSNRDMEPYETSQSEKVLCCIIPTVML